MVTEVTDTEVTEAPTGDVTAEGAESEVVESPEGAEEAEVTEEAPEPDPLAELTAEVAALRLSAATKEELQPLQSGVGRINKVQSELAELAERNPLAVVDPRIASLETAFAAVLDGLIADPATDDARRASLTQSRQQLDAAGRQRDIDSAVSDAVGKALPQKTEQEPEAPAPEQLAVVNEMSGRLIGYAEAKEVDYKSIPANVLAFQPGELLDAAFTRVKSHIDGMAEEAGATERVTARAAAAGGGTPSRSGGASTTEDILSKLESDEGIPMSDTAGRQRAAKALGIELPH